MRLLTFVLSTVISVAVTGCANGSCVEDRQCGPAAYCLGGRCRRDCRTNADCEASEICDVTRRCIDPTVDAGTDAPMLDAPGLDAPALDGGSVVPDAGVDAPVILPDTPMPGFDGGTDAPAPTLGRYLDRCSTDADCMTGHCVDDIGGARTCTISCSGHAECASEHVCAAGLCRHDDTGVLCSGASGCVLGLCAGNPAAGTGECTRPCGSASDCPAGYACSDAGGVNICVNIERPCGVCSTGLCLGAQGCTSTCRTPSDCPATLPGMGYSCSGSQCVPSTAIFGADPIGAPCRNLPDGTTLCRSGVCLTDDWGAEYCSERCTESGGCGPGFGCDAVPDGAGGTILICVRGGTGALGSPCTNAGQCDSAICAPGGYCTRLCTADARCPSDMRCGTGAGATCTR